MSEAWQYRSDGSVTLPGGAARSASAPSDASPAQLPPANNTPSDAYSGTRSRIDPGQAFEGDQGASQLFGELSRAQWADWRARFAPYIERLANRAQDPAAQQEAARDASSAMGLAFDTGRQSRDQDRQSFGISLSPQQRAAEQRRDAIQRSAATVSAGNQARISALDRQGAILAGGMGLQNIPDQVMNQ